MTVENLNRGNQITRRLVELKNEIKHLEEDFNKATKGSKNALVSFDGGHRCFTCRTTKLRQRCYEIIREELEGELVALEHEFEML